MKKIFFIFTGTAILIIVAAILVISAKTGQNPADSDAVAEVDGIVIDRETFTFYKSGLELSYAFRGETKIPDVKELLEKLITDELALREAGKRGVTVSEEEINEQIAYQRDVYENEELLNKDQELVLELMKQRIRITGMTDDEFWNSEIVRNVYRKSMILAIIVRELVADGTIEDRAAYDAYEKELFKRAKKRIKYNEELLKQ